jgi:hypothetical protein
VKAPSALVDIPLVVPFSRTVTPGRPSPVFWSVTRPDTDRVWASATWSKVTMSKKLISRVLFIEDKEGEKDKEDLIFR